ncbi:NAD(P)H-quinone oxidoreductase subunit F [Cyanobacterium aponinum]|uniref:NAD(P)H dehydrogenase, subunit NdhF3 family n=1 Tax=Cyanobacterium aponinum (strain PCC 10605) TaxID=755178 RepID=K9Z774_CYAAP|nr:NAD(P)H-quinone oxidoreductase subunit F [Cyanobacterium aponinum]AFZ55051.1 NAD(P)H dehydrogenase, subunit NdhF3 family [Cyanobacterium aponinum PCC 10605]
MNFFSETIWFIPCYTLIGGLIALLWSPGIIRKTGSRPAGYVNIVMTSLAFIHSVVALYQIWEKPAQEFRFTWLEAAGVNISFDLQISSVSVGALALITGLNVLSQIYAIGYLEMDWGWARFYALMGFFEAGMCGLVLCNSLFFSYVYLEILTLGTYLLVGFWFAQPLVVSGARDAFWTKRVGDILLLMGVIAIYPFSNTWNYNYLAFWAENSPIDNTFSTLLCLALISGPIAKCAQIPLQLWLDEAMEGPLPASILRNAIVVTVGAYVIIQLQPVLAMSPIASQAVTIIGVITAILASLISIAQVDIKRVLSYLVSAYMGLVFIAVGTNHEKTALVLIAVYAVAMALLYMSIGAIIISNITQDLTQLGGLWKKRPLAGIAFLVGSFGLVAFPPLGGFWILPQLGNDFFVSQPWLVGVLLIVDALTAFSLLRTFCLIFLGDSKQMTVRSPEVLWAMVLPMMILTGVTLHLPLVLAQFNLISFQGNLNIFFSVSTLIGVVLAMLIYGKKPADKSVDVVPEFVRNFFANDLYIQDIYKVTVVGIVNVTAKLAYWFDRYIVDGVVNLVGLSTIFGGQALKYSTSGQSQLYIFSILLGLIFVAIIFGLTQF